MNRLSTRIVPVLVCLTGYSSTGMASLTEYEQVIYYHSDALGSPVAATDANGDLLWREEYSPYGSRLLYQSRELDCGSGVCAPEESAWDEKHWFTAKLEETRNGIQYFGARWYEPELGRFLSADPIQFQEDNFLSFNRYAYANNNPYKFTDPDGREVVQVGISFALPEIFGAFQKALNREIEVSGFGLGVAWSSPNIHGEGEYDIGLYLTTHLNSQGVDTGKVAFSYAESADDSDAVKDLASVGGGASVGFGLSGLNATYSGEGIEMIGFHIGPGLGVTVQGNATTVYSGKHGKLGWHRSSAARHANKREKEKPRR